MFYYFINRHSWLTIILRTNCMHLTWHEALNHFKVQCMIQNKNFKRRSCIMREQQSAYMCIYMYILLCAYWALIVKLIWPFWVFLLSPGILNGPLVQITFYYNFWCIVNSVCACVHFYYYYATAFAPDLLYIHIVS